ncbi:MAG: hypothetical protein A2958_00735 [Candidatus Levybacteria bacterium RIFCSPLOWO2_01_FULL_38_13]|nr:MAG: hypothetical protein A2629_00630 [Candidatus Levybacteria bacterium RIFCSPHIGHO2_01_FULL_41_15]OGH34813.1 MAG: hypothetical protein A2958_00735 [Candidatus Levybacteria bacterium RIFCSPLOWO2_01_FULL_38_13]
MSKEILSPMDQAKIEVPRAWYEIDHRAHVNITMAVTLGAYFANLEVFHVNSVPAHIVGAAIFFISNLADRYSSVKGFDADNLVQQSGIDSREGPLEKNILLGDITNSKQFLFSKRALLIDVAATALSDADPGIAASFTIAKIHATVNNLRNAKRLNKAVEIADTRSIEE